MDHKLCKTCDWWNDGKCEFVDSGMAQIPDARFEVGCKVSDDTGLETWLSTGPNFGCVHHQQNNAITRLTPY